MERTGGSGGNTEREREAKREGGREGGRPSEGVQLSLCKLSHPPKIA